MIIDFYVSINHGTFFGGDRWTLDNNCSLTGRYKENIDGNIFVEVLLKKWIFTKLVWVDEYTFKFTETPLIYNCRR
jgi:hypothetical protein